MIVCHCHCVSDRTIVEHARTGCLTAEAIGAACGAGTGCGGCVSLVEDLVDAERLRQGPGAERAARPAASRVASAA